MGEVNRENQHNIMLYLFNSPRMSSEEHSGIIPSLFPSHAVSEHEKAVYGYLRIIMTKSFQLLIIEDEELQNFGNFQSWFII